MGQAMTVAYQIRDTAAVRWGENSGSLLKRELQRDEMRFPGNHRWSPICYHGEMEASGAADSCAWGLIEPASQITFPQPGHTLSQARLCTGINALELTLVSTDSRRPRLWRGGLSTANSVW